jgi:4-alpha-glucanotransferase
LPGPHAIGDLGDESYRFVDMLQLSRQRYWAILPLGPPGYGDSPYSAHSAFAGNPLLISLHDLYRQGLLDGDDVRSSEASPPSRADFAHARAFKLPRLFRAFQRFVAAGGENRPDFLAFCAGASDWLEDYALFMALKQWHRGAAWVDWAPELALPTPRTRALVSARLAASVRFQRFQQFVFHEQWSRLRRYAHDRNVQIIGDLPMFVAHDSVEVWAAPDQFMLDSRGRPRYLAGAPPDYFSADGQLWGNPLYNWQRQAAEGFRWWISRFRALLKQVDLVRIDHFRGFQACWAVSPGQQTAACGEWMPSLGGELLAAVMAAVLPLPAFVEDTGVITPEVDALRTRFGFPGIRLLHWGFLGPEAFHGAGAIQPDSISRHLPHNYPRSCVVYTSTHDTDPSAGWFAALSRRDQTRVRRYLGVDGDNISHDLMRLALASVADSAIIPVQDLLSLGSEARLNVPGRIDGNWQWRLAPRQFTSCHGLALAEMTEVYGRAGPWKG